MSVSRNHDVSPDYSDLCYFWSLFGRNVQPISGDFRYFWLLFGQNALPLREMPYLFLKVGRYKLLILSIMPHLPYLPHLSGVIYSDKDGYVFMWDIKRKNVCALSIYIIGEKGRSGGARGAPRLKSIIYL